MTCRALLIARAMAEQGVKREAAEEKDHVISTPAKVPRASDLEAEQARAVGKMQGNKTLVKDFL